MLGKKGRIVGINGRFTHSCLALFYLRNELGKHCPDLETEIVQFTINDNYYEMLLRLSQGEPDVIFFSAAIWNSGLVEKLTLDLHSCLPSAAVIIGGPQASVLAESGIRQTTKCTVVVGELEAVGESFYKDLMAQNLAPGYQGKFFAMERPHFAYPYLDSDFTTHLLHRQIYYESSRGCPLHCSYCLSAAEKGLYHKDMATVKEELRQILSHKPRVVRFIDRTFNDIPHRALEIWEFLSQEGEDTLFHFEMAPDRFSEEMFSFLKTLDPGRFQFEIGIQSTHEKTLEAVHRTTDHELIGTTVRRLSALANIHLHLDLILGLPYDTRETFAASFQEVFAMGAHYIQMGLLKILPDTPLGQRVVEYGYRFSREAPYSVLESRWMDHGTIRELYWFSHCVEKFVNNRYFLSIWDYLRDENEEVFPLFQSLLTLCHDSGFFQLAATQELLCQKLVTLFADRDDCQLLTELLRYDWLRCNHRFLPDCLKPDADGERLGQLRSSYYQSLPQEIEGVYTRRSRNQFFRKSYFLRISQRTARKIGNTTTSSPSCLCVIGEPDGTIHNLNKVLIF